MSLLIISSITSFAETDSTTIVLQDLWQHNFAKIALLCVIYVELTKKAISFSDISHSEKL